MLAAFPAYGVDALADVRGPLHEAFAHLIGHGASIDALDAGRVVILDLMATGHWDQAVETGAVCTRMAQDSRGSQQRYH